MSKLKTLAAASLAAAALVLVVGCGKDDADNDHGHGHKGDHGHEAAHGGCLNAIGNCETGHAEVKVEEDVLKLWFVGGGNDTAKAVRVPEKEIVLTVKVEGGKDARALSLKAKPNALAEEKEGDCSCFEGRADWLKGIKTFDATGTVTFKGKKEELKIDFPHGHDPDHGKEHEH